jgi:glycosyltransferase involved in cell wall biosynthesis
VTPAPVRLSVVLPTRNRAGELEGAARSVLDQGVPLELVVVDDGSTDDTPDVLDRLADEDSRVRVVSGGDRSPLGPCVARNRGLEVASGELVAFCDDDDRWLPGAAATVLDFLGAHPEVVMASAWHVVAHVELGTSVVFRGPTDYGARHLLWQNFVAVPFGLVRRSVLPFEVGFDPALPTGEDWDLWLRCARHGAVRTVPRPLYRYTQHRTSRVTRTAHTQVEGRRRFLAKHGAAMTPACRCYHEAIVAGLDAGRGAVLSAVGHEARRAPGAGAEALALLAASALTSRIGLKRHDPGLQARTMRRLVGRR